ncbi:MAG TPA: Ig domain-containing protein [Terriglobales bacterium]|nr:Ig domain-containing protein [Terriglobales bacterium]
MTVTAPASAALAITTTSVPNAQTGTAYSYTLAAAGGTSPYRWGLGGGSLPQGFSLNSAGQLAGSATQAGSFNFTASVTDSANTTVSKSFSLSVSAPPAASAAPTGYDGPAELPRVYMQTSLASTPAPGTVVQVSAGGSLQSALTNAHCGDTITLAAGAVFSGLFTFPAKACDDQHWIIVRTSAPDTALPPEGSRMTPCYAGVSSLPGRPAYNCPAVKNVLAQITDPQLNSTGPIVLASGANHYRLIGLEITRTAGTGIDYQLVSVPTGTADHIILDRVWLHGTPQDETKNGINLSGMSYAALIDSYTSDFHCISGVGACTDAKVVGGGNSTSVDGVFKITNNFLEASGENILFGGGSATTTPSDIEIRHNHFYKPLIWKQGQPGFVGGPAGNPFMVKNLLELKNAQRVLIEGNIFEYSWGGFSQNGYGILLTPKNQSSGCPICEVTDVTLRYNTLSHTGAGISMANVPDDNGAIATAGERYSIHDMTIDDIDMGFYNGSGTLFQVFNGWPNATLNNISINHVTAFPDPSSKVMSLSNNTSNPQMYAYTLTNSIIGQALYPIWSATGNTTDCSYSNIPLTSLNTCFTTYKFSSNAIFGINLGNYPATKWPAGNFFPSSASAVQFTNFNNGNGGNYTLLSTSPYKNAASDGKDLGADISAIQAAIAGVY